MSDTTVRPVLDHGIRELAPGERNDSIRAHLAPVPERLAYGKELRKTATSRSEHGKWEPEAGRPDPIDLLERSNEGRVEELVPIRHGRMAASPFAFYRGAAGIQAWDFAHTPDIGMRSWICGDAHLSNFGFFGSSEGDLAFDINDFDETHLGPWEWDLKRLAASIHVAARDRGFSEEQGSEAVRSCVRIYRETLRGDAGRTLLSLHRAKVRPDQLGGAGNLIHKRTLQTFTKAGHKATQRTNDQVLQKLTVQEQADGRWRFDEIPPLQVRLHGKESDAIIEGLERYLHTLSGNRANLVRSYGVQDVALRVVGVGSVGTRPYVVMLLGNGPADALFLQVKEAPGSQLAPYLPPHGIEHEGERVITGQRSMQARSGPFVGWTTVGGRHFYVRQLRDMKGSIEVERLDARGLADYGLLLGGVLASAHARVADAAILAGYVGKGEQLDDSIAAFARAYADQNEADHAALLEAIDSGRVRAEMGV